MCRATQKQKGFFVNVTVENLGPCKKLLRVEVEVKDVEIAFETVTTDYARHAALPGFRPGKAPRGMVAKRYEKDIAEEAKKKLTSDNYQQAIKDQKINVYHVDNVEDIQFARGQAMQFAVTLEVLPEFELPEYRKLPAFKDNAVVSEADVDKAVEMLQGQHAKFETVTRPLANGDIGVLTYQGTCEGKPMIEVAPDAKGVAANKDFWVNCDKDAFVPGFMEQMVGAQAGEKRTVNVTFPANFTVPQLAGKPGVYEVELVEVKQRVLPPLDDAFAKKFEAADLAALRAGVRKDLENELTYRKRENLRQQVVSALLAKVNIELPETAIKSETRNVVYDIVSNSQQRGVSRDVIEKSKDEIYSVATNSAKERVKASFVLNRIAEKEALKVTQEELSRRLYAMAAQYQMPVDKFVRELQKREGLPEVHEQLLVQKVVDFLADNAELTDAPPASAAPAEPAKA
jgi:trigger factor